MADTPERKKVIYEELMLNNLALTDALAKLLIAKGIGELPSCVEAAELRLCL